MDCTNYSTTRRKGQHLNFEERVLIETRRKDGWNPNQISKEIGCCYNAVKKEIKRGTVLLYNEKLKRYKARVGQAVYEMNRRNSLKKYKLIECMRFIQYVEQHVEEDGRSLDTCFGKALESGESGLCAVLPKTT